MFRSDIPCVKKKWIRKRRSRNEMKILRIIFFILETVLIIIVAFLYYLAFPLYLHSSQFFIPKGSITKIIAYMQKKSIPVTHFDTYILRLIGKPQYGWVELGQKNITKLDFLYKITKAKAPLFQITLIPGETTYNFLYSLHKHYHYPLKVLQNEYKKHAPYPEGIFFPNTYYLPKGMEAEELIEYLVRRSLAIHRYIAMKYYGNFNEKLWFTKIITIASIIQKEAATIKEMPLIASVIYNRLKHNMPLQMDGTLNYGKYSHIKVTPKRIKEDTTKFNTYKFKGLPPYPVCMVSIAAIKAAIAPAHTKYYYFVKGKNGLHQFSKTYKSHLRKIKRVQKRNKK